MNEDNDARGVVIAFVLIIAFIALAKFVNGEPGPKHDWEHRNQVYCTIWSLDCS